MIKNSLDSEGLQSTNTSSTSFWKKISQCPWWHPIIFVFFPLAFQCIKNDLSLFEGTLQSSLTMLVGATAFAIVTGLIFRSVRKALVLLSFLCVFYFIYGSNKIPFQEINEGEVVLAVNYCTPFLAGNLFSWSVAIPVVLAAMFLLGLKEQTTKNLTVFLNLSAIFLIAFNVFPFLKNEAAIAAGRRATTEVGFSIVAEQIPITQSSENQVAAISEIHPDIYLIIPDGCSGYMTTAYGPNSIDDFVEFLEARNFSVPKKCMSNYPATPFSVPSMVNVDYLHNLNHEPLKGAFKITEDGKVSCVNIRAEVAELRKTPYEGTNTFVATYLLKKGYDHVVLPRKPDVADARVKHKDFLSAIPNTPKGKAARFYAPQSFAVLDALERVSGEQHEKPRFIMAHFMMPHPPFMINVDGTYNSEYKSERSPAETKMYYAQRRYVINRLKEVIGTILEHSNRPVVIVIASDHAQNEWISNPYDSVSNPVGELNSSLPYSVFRLANFIAVLLPEGKRCELPADLTNVNIFRFVLNQTFGENYPILENMHYKHIKAGSDGYYGFVDNTDEVKQYLRDFAAAVTAFEAVELPRQVEK